MCLLSKFIILYFQAPKPRKGNGEVGRLYVVVVVDYRRMGPIRPF